MAGDIQFQDISSIIGNRQASDIPSTKADTTNKDEQIEIKDPIIIAAQEGTFTDLFQFFFIQSTDKLTKGIFWQNSKEDILKGYIKDLNNDKLQYLVNKKVHETITDSSHDEHNRMEQKMRKFRESYKQPESKFTVLANSSFFKKNEIKSKKIIKGGS
jgi:hypothetical protein